MSYVDSNLTIGKRNFPQAANDWIGSALPAAQGTYPLSWGATVAPPTNRLLVATKGLGVRLTP